MQKNRELDTLHKNYSALLVALKNHNIFQAGKAIRDIRVAEPGFWERISAYLVDADDELDLLKTRYTDNFAYTKQIQELLISKGIPAEADEASFKVGPIDIAVHVNEYYIQLSMGKKKIRITDLEHGKAVKHIESFYKKLNSSFNSNLFFKRLLKAYEIINQRMYNSKGTSYGFAVSLKEVFELFSLSPAAVDYKIENFLWDIGRLCTQTPQIDVYRIELGSSRDARKMYEIKTALGQTLKASTITLYKEESYE